MAYYTKLPIVLLSELAAGKEDSNNCRISRYLLERLDCLEDVSIEGLAGECFVSKATISRFCRDIGLEDFSELRDLLHQTEKTFTLYGQSLPPKEQGLDFCRRVNQSLRLAAETMDYGALERLAGEIKEAKARSGLWPAESGNRRHHPAKRLDYAGQKRRDKGGIPGTDGLPLLCRVGGSSDYFQLYRHLF